jgi:hypothetical protein
MNLGKVDLVEVDNERAGVIVRRVTYSTFEMSPLCIGTVQRVPHLEGRVQLDNEVCERSSLGTRSPTGAKE